MHLLSIFSGFLWGIDLICILLLVWFIYSGKRESADTGKPFTGTTFFVLSVFLIFLWVGSIIWRAIEI